jgi:hypothetical protein
MIVQFDCAPDAVELMLSELPRTRQGGLVGEVAVVACYCIAPGVVLIRGCELTAHWPRPLTFEFIL